MLRIMACRTGFRGIPAQMNMLYLDEIACQVTERMKRIAHVMRTCTYHSLAIIVKCMYIVYISNISSYTVLDYSTPLCSTEQYAYTYMQHNPTPRNHNPHR